MKTATITNKSGRTNARTSKKDQDFGIETLISTEALQKLNWKNVKVIFHPTEEIQGYAVFDTVNETIIAKGTKWQCEKFLVDWSAALRAVERNLEKAEYEFLVGNHKAKGQYLQLAMKAAKIIRMKISDRTDLLRGTGLSSPGGLGTLVIAF